MIDLKNVTACLITKDPVYPPEVLAHTAQFGFGEILILTNCDSPYRKYELFKKAKYDILYYSDDDAICPIQELSHAYIDGKINLAIKQGHYNAHIANRATMGLGWGAIFPKILIAQLERYVRVYGEDDVFKRETERILTYLNFPQNRMVLPIIDLPSAYGNDRLWRQADHLKFKEIAEERCKKIIIGN